MMIDLKTVFFAVLVGEALAFWIQLIYCLLKELLTGEDCDINPFYPEL